MANHFEDWLKNLSSQTGAEVEQSDLDRLRNTNPGDDLDRLMGAYESQYKVRGDSGQTGSGQDSSERSAAGYGSARTETADDRSGGDLSGDSRGRPTPTSTTNSWLNKGGAGGGTTVAFPDWYRQLLEGQQSQAAAQAAANKERSDALYGRLKSDADQSLAIDRNDPIIRAQSDAFAANQERGRRNYISDTAESTGPFANIQGEKRMASERYGAETGKFEAGLLGQELMSRRAQISQRLNSMAGMLSGEQQQELQRQLSLMDQAIKEQQVAMGYRGQDITTRGQDIGNDEFLRDLALRESFGWDDRNYRNIYG